VIRLVVMMYVRFPLSLRNVEDLLFVFSRSPATYAAA
jgi:transposase-like protein